MKSTIVRIDTRNRISLTKISSNLSSLYRAYEQDNKIILEPIQELKDHWLFQPENRHLLEKLERGLKQEANIDLGSFEKYLDNEE